MNNDHENGNVTGNRAQMDQALRASELNYRRLFETAQDGILILDADTGRVNDVNPFLIKLLGFTHDEMVGKTVGELSPFKDIVHNQAMLARLQKDRYIRYHDLPLETKDGRKVDVEFVSNVYQVGDEKVIQCNIREITARKRAEVALHAAQQFLTEIVNALPARVFWKDKNLVYLGCNTVFARDAGFAGPKDIIGKEDCQMVWREQAEAYRSDDRKVMTSGQSKLVFEETQTTPAGKNITVLSSKLPLRDVKGEIIGVLGTYMDITERKTLESQFRQAQKMEAVGQLAGGVAHDFNNILAVIQGYSDLLKTDSGLSPAQLGYVEEIGSASQRAAVLTRQLLLFSRKQTLQLHDLDLNESINDMTKMLRRTIGEDIELQFKFAMQPLPIHADAGMMDQVLMNLAVNARDAMPKGGRLVIETSIVEFDESAALHSAQIRPGSFVCLSVSDTGHGISAENLPRIFEPFFTTKDVGKGTGIGLATVFGIVQEHQGWINVYSEAGHGTTFRIYLPRLAGVSPQKPRQAALAAMRGGDEMILLVEDDALLRASLRKILSQLGYRVFEAGNGIEALEVWKQNRDEIRLVVTDLVMPGGMTGKNLGKRLLKENPKLKVIYVSGYSAEIASKDFPLKEGVNFLAKPFQAQKLAQTVRNCLDDN
jgi:PAS domain S-box-containing protein